MHRGSSGIFPLLFLPLLFLSFVSFPCICLFSLPRVQYLRPLSFGRQRPSLRSNGPMRIAVEAIRAGGGGSGGGSSQGANSG
ncbi:hypothetical protein ASPBRDRAFT_41659 [Aspergillus brasiliensis CBS 101740]|uniref:Uncharacterized protein n=1 Tax=Aspergillus brasiliensis (strain CBS 101740 / IMI 381727 / IBT 21946) TaxID=767769 RepID=A0A1L9UQL4_ASPBC|nr:hypothetical protein ASPBRDRAFT_41659 [Aspergillus brasiliensis CBS 101740]